MRTLATMPIIIIAQWSDAQRAEALEKSRTYQRRLAAMLDRARAAGFNDRAQALADELKTETMAADTLHNLRA